MSNKTDLKTKIAGVKKTKKITAAMEMVAASRMKATQERMNSGRLFVNSTRIAISNFLHSSPEKLNDLAKSVESNKVSLILITTDKGLCGGLNNNLYKEMESTLKKEGKEIKSILFIGKKGSKKYSNYQTADNTYEIEKVHMNDENLNDSINYLKDELINKQISGIKLVFNKFESTMSQKKVVKTIFPIAHDVATTDNQWDYIYESEQEETVDMLMDIYLHAEVGQGIKESQACEQTSRMMAMKAATDSANDMVNDLEKIYNRARQASITQEISEIVSGAQAV